MSNSDLAFYETIIANTEEYDVSPQDVIKNKLTKEEKRLRKLHKLFEKGDLFFE